MLSVIQRWFDRLRRWRRRDDFAALVQHHQQHGNYDLPPDQPATPEIIDVEYTVIKESSTATAVDLLGVVLARCWIESDLVLRMEQDPMRTLDEIGVQLPKGMSIEFARTERNRPSVVLYERRGFMRRRDRICSFQLTMTASR